jgi:hypothetical protein
MGLGDDIKEFEQDATGQGGRDSDNNADNSNGSNDKTEDTLVDSGMYHVLHPPLHIEQNITNTFLSSGRPIRKQGGHARRL